MCSFSVGFSLLISDWSDQRPMSGVSIEVRANLTDVRGVDDIQGIGIR